MFPFKYENRTYTSCTKASRASPWCYTDEDGKWGECNAECVKEKQGGAVTPLSSWCICSPSVSWPAGELPTVSSSNKNSCDEGVRIENDQECKKAAEALGVGYQEAGSWADQPRGCATDAAKDTIWFNENATGAAAADKALVCQGEAGH